MQQEKAKTGVPRWLILLTVIIGTFLGRLDQTIVNLALPHIINDFSITVSSAGWIATAYILANAIFVPVWGKLGDLLGRKKIYILGFSIFIFGSILAGFAWNLSSMIVFRIIQAIAGSADYPTAMAILAVTYTDDKERSQALGIWSASFAAAAVFGPLIGGPLIDNFGWRSVFLINLPVGIVGLFMALAFISESRSQTDDKKIRKFDLKGAIILGISLATLVLVLDQGTDWGWLSANSFICYAITLASMLWFIRVEKRHSEPIVDLKFFKNQIFVQTLMNNFIIFMGMMGSIFLVPVFVQTFLGFGATETGYIFLPMAAGMMLAAPLGARLSGKVQPKYIIAASTVVAALGIYLFSFLDPRSNILDIIIPLTIMAFGMGFGMAQRTNIIASVVPAKEIGIASSILALVRNIAGAFGIAIFGSILNSAIEDNVLNVSGLSHFHGQTAAQYGTFSALIGLKAQIDAYDTVFIVSTIIVFSGAILILFMKNIKMRPDVKVHVEA